MTKYVGTKLVEAVPMDKHLFYPNAHIPSANTVIVQIERGYKVTYPDGYISWSPKEVFEKAYMKVGDNNTVQESNVNDFIVSYDTQQWGDKTTIVCATLANGFIVTESSSCVDPANFNIDIGYNICKERIQNKVWEMLGFLLQTAQHGLK